jgi:hypothetical protein
MAALEKITGLYPAAANLRCDNGHGFIDDAIKRWAESTTTAMAYIEPGSRGCKGLANRMSSARLRLQRPFQERNL